ncbi:MAG: hypothetical protein KF758_05375 [Anaerolineales bacterium]|jgi:hypothetical protein|nr:hypothetical protein [Anaerolineales bacterium]
MKNIKSFFLNLLVMLGFIITGILITTTLGYGFVILDEAGAFGGGSWKLIESPIKFKHIADATTQKIWAVTEENKYYCLGFPGCDQWTETEEVSVNSHEEYDHTTISKNTCKSDVIIKYPIGPYGNVVECALTIKYFGVETRSIVYHAILDDGTIWVWRSSGPWYVGLGILVILASPFIGLVLGLFIYTNFRKYQQSKIEATV